MHSKCEIVIPHSVDPNTTVATCPSYGVVLGVSIAMMILFNVTIIITLTAIIVALVRSRKKVQIELERMKTKVENPGIYEELDYMYVDHPVGISTKDNISYSIKASSEISVYEDTK